MHDSLLVFDLETVPDTDAAPNLLGDLAEDVSARREALAEYHRSITGGKNAFLRQPFHKVVAIAFLEAKIEKQGKHEHYSLEQVRAVGDLEASEKELVHGFFQHFEHIKPRLVTFNGRSFDLPVLKYRAMVHGVSAACLHQAGDKWNSYNSRYSLDWHCDLLEALSDFGASARVKLNEVCAVLGKPGKFGVDGSKVSDMYDAGELKAIRDYCETDVINTYLVYLRWMHHRGVLPTTGYNSAIEDIMALLERESGAKPHFLEFQQAWAAACKGEFYWPEAVSPSSPGGCVYPEY